MFTRPPSRGSENSSEAHIVPFSFRLSHSWSNSTTQCIQFYRLTMATMLQCPKWHYTYTFVLSWFANKMVRGTKWRHLHKQSRSPKLLVLSGFNSHRGKSGQTEIVEIFFFSVQAGVQNPYVSNKCGGKSSPNCTTLSQQKQSSARLGKETKCFCTSSQRVQIGIRK